MDFLLTRIGEIVNYPDADKGWKIKAEHDRVDQTIAQKVIDALDGNDEVESLIALLGKIAKEFD